MHMRVYMELLFYLPSLNATRQSASKVKNAKEKEAEKRKEYLINLRI